MKNNNSRCKSCGQRIYWIVTKNNKPMPKNVSDDMPHFVSCPDAVKFRKPKTKKGK